MASDILTATQLVAVLTVYCVVFCPILCWAIGGVSPFDHSTGTSKNQSHA